VSLWVSSSDGRAGFVGGGAEHGELDVDAAAGQIWGGVVFLAFGAFPVVVGPGRGVGEAGERGEE
jgi:hypothetical protein